MAQLSAAIDGIAEACDWLGTPVTGGNVSLYNETKGEGIYPTPVLGVVGILDDVTKAVPSDFQSEGDFIFLLTDAMEPGDEAGPREFGSSEYAKTVLGCMWGTPPFFEAYDHMKLQSFLVELASKSLIKSACDISDGGLAVAIARSAIKNGIGARVQMKNCAFDYPLHLFRETGAAAIITCNAEQYEAINQLMTFHSPDRFNPTPLRIGRTGGTKLEISIEGTLLIDAELSELVPAYTDSLESQLAAEVLA